MKRLFTEKAVIVTFTALLVMYNAVLVSGFYWRANWLDIPLHAAGGFVVAQFLAAWFRTSLKRLPLFTAAVFLVSGAIAVGVAWEWFEWVMDHVVLQKTAAMQATVDDTLSDLLMDTLGAALLAALWAHNTRS